MVKGRPDLAGVVSSVSSLPIVFTDVEGPWSIRRIAKTHVKGPSAIGGLFDPYHNVHGQTTASSIESLRFEMDPARKVLTKATVDETRAHASALQSGIKVPSQVKNTLRLEETTPIGSLILQPA